MFQFSSVYIITRHVASFHPPRNETTNKMPLPKLQILTNLRLFLEIKSGKSQDHCKLYIHRSWYPQAAFTWDRDPQPVGWDHRYLMKTYIGYCANTSVEGDGQERSHVE